jgi:hypothetical protein
LDHAFLSMSFLHSPYPFDNSGESGHEITWSFILWMDDVVLAIF